MTAPTRELPRLLGHYRESIAPALQEEFGYVNVMQIPRLTKIVVNMGGGAATRDAKLMDGAVRDLTAITGQRPAVVRARKSIAQLQPREGMAIRAEGPPGGVRALAAIAGQRPAVVRARKSIAQFKLREGMPIGAKVTLRGDRMWEFLDRLVTIALPRIRDFRGLSPKQFDGNGNYTFGLNEQSMFHEIDIDKVDRTRGMDITVVTTATNDDEGRALLRALGFPFKES